MATSDYLSRIQAIDDVDPRAMVQLKKIELEISLEWLREFEDDVNQPN